MYAIVSTGGKQYRVERGQSLLVERLPVEDGGEATLRPLLFVDGDNVVDGEDLAKVTVQARVVGHERGPKLRVVKFKPKRGYKRRTGHRQELTRIEVTEIKLASRRPSSRGTPKPVAADQAGSGAEAAATGAEAAAKPARRRSTGGGAEGEVKPARRQSSAKTGEAEAAEPQAKPARTRTKKTAGETPEPGTAPRRSTASEPKNTASEPKSTASEPKSTASEPKSTASEPKNTAPEPENTAPEPKNTASETEEEGNGA